MLPWRECEWATCRKLSTLGGCGAGSYNGSLKSSLLILEGTGWFISASTVTFRGGICAYVSLPLV